jgi:hypothetical protein
MTLWRGGSIRPSDRTPAMSCPRLGSCDLSDTPTGSRNQRSVMTPRANRNRFQHARRAAKRRGRSVALLVIGDRPAAARLQRKPVWVRSSIWIYDSREIANDRMRGRNRRRQKGVVERSLLGRRHIVGSLGQPEKFPGKRWLARAPGPGRNSGHNFHGECCKNDTHA